MADIWNGPLAAKRIEAVHSLRGIAALAVALFHLTNGDEGFYAPHALSVIADEGRLGVEVFFVISGFVLPYSLRRAGYGLSLANFGIFVRKRAIRLDPPYLLTVAVLLAWLGTFAPAFRGPPFHPDWLQIGLRLNASSIC